MQDDKTDQSHAGPLFDVNSHKQVDLVEVLRKLPAKPFKQQSERDDDR